MYLSHGPLTFTAVQRGSRRHQGELSLHTRPAGVFVEVGSTNLVMLRLGVLAATFQVRPPRLSSDLEEIYLGGVDLECEVVDPVYAVA
jgi:hypothetical protein